MNICIELYSQWMLSYTKIAMLCYNSNFLKKLMMAIFRDDRMVIAILSYINWYLHKYNATWSIAEIFTVDIFNQL